MKKLIIFLLIVSVLGIMLFTSPLGLFLLNVLGDLLGGFTMM